MPAQSECIVNHVFGNQTAAAVTPGFSSPSSRAPQLASSPHNRLLLSSSAFGCALTVPSDDEDLVTELVSLLARAGLAPPSSRRPVAAMLCAAGVGSAEALLLALDRDPSFLSNQVHFVTFAAWFACANMPAAAVAVPASSRLHHRLHPRFKCSAFSHGIAVSVAMEPPGPAIFHQPTDILFSDCACRSSFRRRGRRS